MLYSDALLAATIKNKSNKGRPDVLQLISSWRLCVTVSVTCDVVENYLLYI